MRDVLDRWSWPARRFLADRLVGEHAYSRNVAPWSFNVDSLAAKSEVVETDHGSYYRLPSDAIRFQRTYAPFDREAS